MSSTENTPTEMVQAPYQADTFVSDHFRELSQIVGSIFLCGSISVAGILANTINLIVFYRQGPLTDCSTLTLFALTFADTGCVLTVFFVSLIDVIMISQAECTPCLMYIKIIVSWLHITFVYIGSWITAFLAFHRCVSVVFPFKAKTLLSRKNSLVGVIIIFILIPLMFTPSFCSSQLKNVKDPNTNSTVLAVVTDTNLIRMSSFTNNFLLRSIIILVIFVCNKIIIYKVKMSQSWRESMAGASGGNRENEQSANRTSASTTSAERSRSRIKLMMKNQSGSIVTPKYRLPALIRGHNSTRSHNANLSSLRKQDVRTTPLRLSLSDEQYGGFRELHLIGEGNEITPEDEVESCIEENFGSDVIEATPNDSGRGKIQQALIDYLDKSERGEASAHTHSENEVEDSSRRAAEAEVTAMIERLPADAASLAPTNETPTAGEIEMSVESRQNSSKKSNGGKLKSFSTSTIHGSTSTTEKTRESCTDEKAAASPKWQTQHPPLEASPSSATPECSTYSTTSTRSTLTSTSSGSVRLHTRSPAPTPEWRPPPPPPPHSSDAASSRGSRSRDSNTPFSWRRQRRLIIMITIISTIFLICNFPGLLVMAVLMSIPAFKDIAPTDNLFPIMMAMQFFLESFNSSINIAVYYKMSTRYRHEFQSLFGRRNH